MIDDYPPQFILDSLPAAPARVLEIGAGDGALAQHLRRHGYDVVAIDPAGGAPGVRQVSLLELDEPPASFDAAVAVVSLHHVEPLAESCAHLGELIKPGGPLVVDEFDMALVDMRAARWFAANRADHHEHLDLEEMIDHMRSHLHTLDAVLTELERWFELGETERVPYLYRWARRPELYAAEQAEIAGDALPATGARVVGRRR